MLIIIVLFNNISKSEAIHLLEDYVLGDGGEI